MTTTPHRHTADGRTGQAAPRLPDQATDRRGVMNALGAAGMILLAAFGWGETAAAQGAT